MPSHIKSRKLHRIDRRHIKNFKDHLRIFVHEPDWSWSSSDVDPRYLPKGMLKDKGLFATSPLVASVYSVPRGCEYIHMFLPDNSPVVIFQKKDKQAIEEYHPWLSVFLSHNFHKINHSEWFSSNPGKPIKQLQIRNPIGYMKAAGWHVIFAKDIRKWIEFCLKYQDFLTVTYEGLVDYFQDED